jgi:hypothetical protein
MATKTEKTLAQAICGLSDLLSLLKPQLQELWEEQCELQTGEDGVVPDKLANMQALLGADDPIRKLAEDILAQEDTLPVAPSVGIKADDRFHYNGLEQIKMTQAERDALPDKVCKFSVVYQGRVVLEVYWDKKLDWVMYPKNAEKTDFGYACKKPFGSKNAKTMGGPAQFLQKLAKAEIDQPGSFASTYYPPDWKDVTAA